MPPEVGGVSISSDRLMNRLLTDGHDVSVFSLSYNQPKLNNKWLKMLKFLFIPVWVFLQPKFDIIHCHVAGVFRKRYLSAFKWAFRGAKLIYSMHGDVVLLLDKPVEKALKKADLIICVQQGDAHRIENTFSVPSVDIPAFIMPVGVAEHPIPDHVMDFIHHDDAPLMLAAGGVVLTEQHYDLYGLRDTIDLYFELRKSGLVLRLLLVIIGNTFTSSQRRYLDEINSLIIRDSNVMVVEGQNMPLMPLFKHAKLFLRPTKTDGDALSVREALAMQCNTLASDVAIRPEGALVYHNKQEMFQLAQDVFLGKKASFFNCEDYYLQLVKAYEKLLS